MASLRVSPVPQKMAWAPGFVGLSTIAVYFGGVSFSVILKFMSISGLRC